MMRRLLVAIPGVAIALGCFAWRDRPREESLAAGSRETTELPADELARFRADVRAQAVRSHSELADSGSLDSYGSEVDIEVETYQEEMFATYSGPYQHMVGDGMRAVVHRTRNGVDFVRIEATPWLPGPEELTDSRSLTWAYLERGPGGIALHAVIRHRRTGDVGIWVTYRWSGDHFIPTEIRERQGGTFVIDSGPVPIVAPVEIRCAASLTLAPSTTHSATLERTVRTETTRSTVVLEDDDCSQASEDTIACGGDLLAPVAEYTVVSSGDDWSIVRVNDETRREIARMPRGCAL